MEPTPKDRFSSLDALALVRELRALGPVRVEKAFDAPPGGWALSLKSVRVERTELRIIPGRYAALLVGRSERPEELSPVARELRRLLTGAVIRSVPDPGSERYLEIEFARADEPGGLILAAEFFGAGNLVVARGGKIALVVRPRSWAHRTVRVGAAYARPPTRADPWTMDAAAIDEELRRSRSDLPHTLAARLALGGPVAEEVVARLEARDAPQLGQSLRHVLDGLLSEVGDQPNGYLYRRAGTLVDATPHRSRRWDGLADEERVASFSDAAAAFFPTALAPAPSPEELERRRGAEEIERLIERQQRAVAELAEAALEKRSEADTILAHLPEVELEVQRARAEGRSEVTLVFEGRSVVVPTADALRRTARSRYEESKRLTEKRTGAETALAESLARRAAPVAAAVPVPARPATPTGKPFWFERYRWFITSDGAIVIAGRDAASNDLVVRRNLKDGDLYLHADLHGAASVVVKRSGADTPVSETSIAEAAQWAVAFSKAWRAGLASASAFWANRDQLSKSGASGEFVARGAWVVHGTKHVVKDLPLELAVGPITHEGRERWTAAPPPAVRARGEVRVLLTPGDERERGRTEETLVRDLGVPRPLLQSLLPAGGISVRRA